MSHTTVRARHAISRVRHHLSLRQARSAYALTPIAAAVLAVASGLSVSQANAQSQPVSGAWFAAQGAVQRSLQSARTPAVVAGTAQVAAGQQQAQARAQLARSLENLGRSASAIAAQQAAQQAARAAAINVPGVPDGYVQGGLWDMDAVGNRHVWSGADRPVHTQDGDKHTVAIKQTADKAVLNWETFNVGRNTTVAFQQNSTDAVLNRVVGADTSPSQIQGAIKGDGTVMIVNQNGVVFSGSSQVNVRNLVAAAAEISDAQFASGLYGADGSKPSLHNAKGKVLVAQGAQIASHAPAQSTTGGGYVLLLGKEVENAGSIHTPKGQTQLAAGDSFIIRKGQSTEGNLQSTTRGNEVEVDGVGMVRNAGLIQSPQGDITLTANQVEQSGVLASSTTVNQRGTIHLKATNTETDAGGQSLAGQVRLGQDAVTAILVDAEDATAFDNQRDSLFKPMIDTTSEEDTIARADAYRRDLSLVKIDSSGTVDFDTGSLTLATGGQVAVDAAQRALVRDQAVIDVSGAIGVSIAMESNNVKINIQGNEMRDAPVNRDSDPENNRSHLSSNDVWIDMRSLVPVPKGTNGYDSDRWYTAGGLLEVGGYLGTRPSGAGQWLAQGGMIRFSGQDVITQAGSQLNLSGGVLDVQDGYVRQSWLRGTDGRLYTVDNAPGDLLYLGLYKGYEQTSERWGVTRTFYNHIMAPTRRWESGYSVGRDAGALVIGTKNAVLEGDVVSDTYQGPRQIQAPLSGVEGYYQTQQAMARGGQLMIGRYTPYYVKESGRLQYGLDADANTVQRVIITDNVTPIAAGLTMDSMLPETHDGVLYLDTALLNEAGLGAVRIAATGQIAVDDHLTVMPGGEITLYGETVDINANVTAHAGLIRLGNVLNQATDLDRIEDTRVGEINSASVSIAKGIQVNASGLWSNLRLAPENLSVYAFQNGGQVSIRNSGDISLHEGSVIDVSSGASLTSVGDFSGGSGGSVTLAINDNNPNGNGRLTMGGEQLLAYGVDGGGTLSLRANEIVIGAQTPSQDANVLHLDNDLFTSGFSRYEILGGRGLQVVDGTQLNVVMPVYQYSESALEVATGQAPMAALQRLTLPLYVEDPVTAVLTQRRGASLRLVSGVASTGQTEQALRIGKDAAIYVDPGQSIALQATGQMTVEGRLQAPGGRVELSAQRIPVPNQVSANITTLGPSIWIGSQAVIDVAGRAATAVDAQGRRYGLVDAGGDIVIGGQVDAASRNILGLSQSRFVVIQSGAVLDASGAQAELDIPGQGAVTVASRGGRISLASAHGLYLDGLMRAASGGSGAAGGELQVAMQTAIAQSSTPQEMRVLRELVVRQHWQRSEIGADAEAADVTLTLGYSNVAAEQVQAGGFGTLTLYSGGMLTFDGAVDLAMDHALNLYAGALGLSNDAHPDSHVSLSAPYVRLAGSVLPAVPGSASVNWLGMHYDVPAPKVSQEPLAGDLTLAAGVLLEVVGGDGLGSGANLTIPGTGGAPAQVLDRRGFSHLAFTSEGDLRFGSGNLYLASDLTLAAAQIYPMTHARAIVSAGWRNSYDPSLPNSFIRVQRIGTQTTAAPYSVFGSLRLSAETVEQGGVLRAPMGLITLGGLNSKVVRLLPGSVTSASASGLIMPYGGTVDGQVWRYDGAASELHGVGSVTAGSVVLMSDDIDVNADAVIDISGGGELTGAGFVSGRGGSTDARYHPLMQVSGDGLTLPTLDTNPVYAIVPGEQALVAPGLGEAGASDPLLGQRITLSDGVPGLPAGDYTLLPSTYALLPGAYRVEINGKATQGAPVPTHALRNGSWATSGMMSIAGATVRDSAASQVILTPADALRKYAQYNETSYRDFVYADAARLGVPRAQMTDDAKSLVLVMGDRENRDALSLRFEGDVLANATKNGYGSTLAILPKNTNASIEILGDGSASSADYQISVRASDLNRLPVNRLSIGTLMVAEYGLGGNMLQFDGNIGGTTVTRAGTIVLRSGARLSAPDVLLMSQSRNDTARDSNAIVIEQGAVIDTLGQGPAVYDSNDGFIFRSDESAALSVSNGRQQWLAPVVGTVFSASPIRIGTCATTGCAGTTQLYSDGSIVFVTDKEFMLDDAVRYGTRHLSLGVGAFNVGAADALAAADARGALAPGLVLNQDVIHRLLQGDTSTGAPALETLELIASQSFNVFDTLTISTLDADGNSLLDNLVLTTPAIYGAGDADDVARIQTGHLIWNGTDQAPGAVVNQGAGTGSGTLQIEANQVTFGHGPWAQPDGVSKVSRLALGFEDVNLVVKDRISANDAGGLAIYRQRDGRAAEGGGWQYSGGHLTVITPLWSGESGSSVSVVTGGDILVTAPATGVTHPSASSAVGAELVLTAGGNLRLDTAVALPSGKLHVKAQGDVTLGEQSFLDLSGRSISFFDDVDATQYSWGGDVRLESVAGNIRQADTGLIDISAAYNQGGRLAVIALHEAAGVVDLQGGIRGGSSGVYESGGTWLPYLAGGLTLRAQRLGGDDLSTAFAALNSRLNDGEVFGLRAFQLKQGNLLIQDGVIANQIEVSLDGGHLTVAGTVDASGDRVGVIRLAGKQGLTLSGNAMLDAHGKLLRLDSYRKIIDAPNRALIELDSGNGMLTLSSGVRMDLRHGTEDARVAANPALHDGRALGTVVLNAPRIDAFGNANTVQAADYGDIAIDASGVVQVSGVKSLVVNAMQRYDDAPAGTDPSASGRPYQIIDQAYLDAKHTDSQAFMEDALKNTSLLNDRLAGLNNSQYRQAFHLRPGVQIVSATPGGDLVVSGDLDLSGYRYESLNPGYQKTTIYGSGEPGALRLLAGGDLNIYGSINDGFAPPPVTPDDNGWVLVPGTAGRQNGDLVVPGPGVVLAEGTYFVAGRVLNYDVPLRAVTLPAGTELPADAALAAELTLPAGTVLDASLFDASGHLLYKAGTKLTDALTLPAGSRVGAGARFADSVKFQDMIWPAGVPLPASHAASEDGLSSLMGVYLASDTAIPVGGLIPSLTLVVLPDNALSVPLRPVGDDGRMGRNWAVAAMLPEGSLSWDLRLAAGADLQAADSRLTRPDASGSVIMADSHFSIYENYEKILIPGTPPQPGYVWYWNEQGASDWGETALTPVDPAWGPDDLCTAGVDWCIKVEYIWADIALDFGFKPGEPIIGDDLAWCPSELCAPIREAVPGTPDEYVKGDLKNLFAVTQNFSVVRTGTGDLDLIAGGDVAMQSLYGVYTAGMSTASRAGSQAEAFDRPRSLTADGTYLRTGNMADPAVGAVYEALVNGGASSTYGAWYPDGGGNLLVRAGGNLIGDLVVQSPSQTTGHELRPQNTSTELGQWLWRQASGNTTGIVPIPTAWWINFGTYLPNSKTVNNSGYEHLGIGYGTENADEVDAIPELAGFTGIGTLGGGNLQVDVGGHAGLLERRGSPNSTTARQRSQGLALTVASTGRVLENGELLLTGGGDLNVHIAGNLNPNLKARATAPGSDLRAVDYRSQNMRLTGVLTNLRGALQMQAGEIGGVALQYYSEIPFEIDKREARAYEPFTPSKGMATGGPVLMLGDAVATVNTRGDLVLVGTGDPGRISTPLSQSYVADGVPHNNGGYGWFSLWTDNTAIRLMSAGGDVTPSVQLGDVDHTGRPTLGRDYSESDGRYVWPSQLHVVAMDGSIYMGESALGTTQTNGMSPETSLLLAPSSKGALSLMAGESIFASGYVISRSAGSTTAMPTPFRPAFWTSDSAFHNLSLDAIPPGTSRFPLFTFGVNTVSGDMTGSDAPVRLYALRGDLVGVGSGQILSFPGGARAGQTLYEGAGPVWMRAGRDIVGSGTLLDAPGSVPSVLGTTMLSDITGVGIEAIGNVFVHRHASDVSIVEAGGDIRFGHFNVAGPGLLEISAGGNIVMAGQAGMAATRGGIPIYGETAVRSLGAVVPGDGRPGASIVVQAGLGERGANWTGFVDRYLDPANQADLSPGMPLADQPGKVAKTYERELIEWLMVGYGFAPSSDETATAEALAFFRALPSEQQRIFARSVYFAELRAGGREYNDPEGPRFGSYLRGRQAIEALFPAQDASGNAIAYAGDVLAYGGAGIHTYAGGDIQVLTPGGAQTYGVEGEAPPSTAGVVTQGSGNIQLYSLGSILLGQSRIMTTFGGDILAWSAEGDINAGRGAKTTLVYTPPSRVYDQWGNVTLSPAAPSTGAGIATLNPIPEVPAGDVDLIAPLGTIDAGEAGIRVSGDVNVAALRVVNADNIQVQGESTGIPVVATVNTNALTSASAAATSAATTAQETVARARAEARQNLPSIITVRILGFGNEPVQGSSSNAGNSSAGINPRLASNIHVIGRGELTPPQATRLTADERRSLDL